MTGYCRLLIVDYFFYHIITIINYNNSRMVIIEKNKMIICNMDK